MGRKNVAVIGCGISGLVGIKACKENDFDVVCYERTDTFGGIWSYRESDQNGVPSVAWSTIINTSKELSAFSDFPPPKEFPNYMHHSMMIRYLQMYADHFGLLPHVKFLHEVTALDKADDFLQTGRWIVTVRDIETNERFMETFDAVMVCAGHHIYPNLPHFPGMEQFQGRVMHTHSYKKPAGFEDKVVLVIGIGNSGVDAASEIGTVARKVFLSTRRGAWIFSRVGPYGRPADSIFQTRIVTFLRTILPYSFICTVIELIVNQRFDHSLYNLKPKHRILGQHPTISDDLPNRIISGRVIIKNDVSHFTEHGIVFQDESLEYPVDTVVLATGYKISFPFLSQDIVPTEKNGVRLYKFVFPPNIHPPTLAFVGMIQTVGSIAIAAEMQARWVAQVWSGRQTLPRESDMLLDIENASKRMAENYYDGERHTVQADWIPYMDEIGSLIGVKPNLYSILFTDPRLFWSCLTSPCFPYQFRLCGPHSWSGARDAILTGSDRIIAPLDPRLRYRSLGHRVLAIVPKFLYLGVILSLLLAIFLIWFY